MEKVQIGRVVEFYSNSCLVEIREFKIPCKTPKDQDIVVGDFVEIVPLQDSLEVKGKILNKVQRKTSLKRFHVDMEDTNSLIIRYPKFKRVTHLILSYDAQNLFLKQKNGFGYFMD